MNPLDFVERLSRRARAETPPRLDVANAVMQRIARIEHKRPADRLMPFLFAMSAATAAVAAVILRTWLGQWDPYWEFVNSVRTVMQW